MVLPKQLFHDDTGQLRYDLILKNGLIGKATFFKEDTWEWLVMARFHDDSLVPYEENWFRVVRTQYISNNRTGNAGVAFISSTCVTQLKNLAKEAF